MFLFTQSTSLSVLINKPYENVAQIWESIWNPLLLFYTAQPQQKLWLFSIQKNFFPTSSSSFVSLLSTNSMSILSDRWVGTFLFQSSNDPSFYHHYSWRCVWAYSMVKKSFNWNYSLNLKNGKISISTFTKEIFRAAELGCYGNCGCNWV